MAELKFVDGIDVAPTVLLDLNVRPLAITSFSAPPPAMRRNEVSSFLADGAVDAATAFDRRELSIGLAFMADSALSSAEAWGDLVRRLTSPGWLMHVDDTDNVLFFRTHPSSPSEVEEYRAALRHGERTATLTIPADPFAYGLPESGTATVSNDPTDGGMRFTIEDVKGDVPASLRMEIDWGSSPYGVRERRLVASSDYPAFHHASATLASTGPHIGFWTASTVSDSSAVGGSADRATFIAAGPPGFGPVFVFSDLVPGDYRLVVRAKSSHAAKLSGVTVPSAWRWLDLGVRRAPESAPLGSAWNPAALVEARVKSILEASTTGETIDIDHAVLIPSPGGDGARGSILMAQPPPTATLDGTTNFNVMLLDGQCERVSNPRIPTERGELGSSIDGAGFPMAYPGGVTSVALVRLGGPPSTGSGLPADSKSSTASVVYSYHPRYLYLRGD